MAWALWALTLFGVATALLDRLLRQAGPPDLTLFKADGSTPRLAMVSAAAVGAVLGLRAWVPLLFGGPNRPIPDQLAVVAALAGPGAASCTEAV